MEYLRLWGILSFITGIALLFHTIRKRKSIGLILYVTYLIFAITCVCLGIYCIIRNQYDELCAIIFGIQGGRIKLRSPPKVLTGNFRPSQLSFFLS